MKIKPNTTIVDAAFNLYGSLAGIPAILRQLPVGERIGFDTLPSAGEDVADIGQTWTPDLQGKELSLVVEKVYNPAATAKAPYTTDLFALSPVIEYGHKQMRQERTLQIRTNPTWSPDWVYLMYTITGNGFRKDIDADSPTTTVPACPTSELTVSADATDLDGNLLAGVAVVPAGVDDFNLTLNLSQQ